MRVAVPHGRLHIRAATSWEYGDELAGVFPLGVPGSYAGQPEVFDLGSIRQPAHKVELRVDHDPTKILAASPGALNLQIRADQISFTVPIAQLPATTVTNDALEYIRSGLKVGISPGFIPKPAGVEYRNGMDVITSCDLFELSIVGNPAYPSGKVTTRDDRATPTRMLSWAWL